MVCRGRGGFLLGSFPHLTRLFKTLPSPSWEGQEMTRPPFIALEGIDGTGKTTQCPLLCTWLENQGVKVVHCTDPGGTSAGDQIRSLLLGHRGEMNMLCESLLFMASKAELVSQVIRPALKRKHAVVTDRYLLSTIAYQGYAGGIDVEELWNLGRFATGGLEPDLYIILDMPVKVALTRKGNLPDRVESRSQAYYEAVRRGFLTESQRQPNRVCVVDASPPIEAVHERIVQEIIRVLGQVARA
jgi:dTMP kinase